MLDKKSPVPVYFQLKNLIKKEIEVNKLKPGDPIKTEREYCEEFGISRMTVRQALKELENEGVIIRERGKGSFVSIPRIEQEGLMSFTDMVKKKNMTPTTEVHSFMKIKDSDVAKIFNIDDNDEIYKIVRIRKADNFPVAIEEVYIPVKLVKDFENQDLTKSLHHLLKNVYNYEIAYSKTNFSAVMANDTQKELLSIEDDAPLLKLENVNYSTKPIYYEVSYYKSEQFNITVNLNKNR